MRPRPSPPAARSRRTRRRRRGSARASASMRSCLARSRSRRHSSWYRYCRRPRSSSPIAWMWPRESGQIQTSVHAGGIASVLIRAITSGSRIRSPLQSRYMKPLPATRRRKPGPATSTRRTLAICHPTSRRPFVGPPHHPHRGLLRAGARSPTVRHPLQQLHLVVRRDRPDLDLIETPCRQCGAHQPAGPADLGRLALEPSDSVRLVGTASITCLSLVPGCYHRLPATGAAKPVARPSA